MNNFEDNYNKIQYLVDYIYNNRYDRDGYNTFGLGGNISNALSGISSLAGGFIGSAKIADTSSLESDIKSKYNTTNINNNTDLINAWGNSFRSNRVTAGNLHNGLNLGSTLNSIAGGAISGAQLGGPIGGIIGGGLGLLSSAIGGIIGSGKAKREAERLNDLAYEADTYFNRQMASNAMNIDSNNDAMLKSNFFANGGYAPSKRLREFLINEEDFIPYVYDDSKGRKGKVTSLSQVRKGGTATVGYGFTDKELVKKYLNRDMTKEEAAERFEYELSFRVKELERLPNFYKLSDNVKDALLAIHYNMGDGNMRKRKGLMNALRTGEDDKVLKAIYELEGKAKWGEYSSTLAKRYKETAMLVGGYRPIPMQNPTIVDPLEYEKPKNNKATTPKTSLTFTPYTQPMQVLQQLVSSSATYNNPNTSSPSVNPLSLLIPTANNLPVGEKGEEAANPIQSTALNNLNLSDIYSKFYGSIQ